MYKNGVEINVSKNVKWPREKYTLHGTDGRGEETIKQVKNTRQLEINLSRFAKRKKETEKYYRKIQGRAKDLQICEQQD